MSHEPFGGNPSSGALLEARGRTCGEHSQETTSDQCHYWVMADSGAKRGKVTAEDIAAGLVRIEKIFHLPVIDYEGVASTVRCNLLTSLGHPDGALPGKDGQSLRVLWYH